MLTFRDDGMELFAAVQAAYGGSLFLHPFGEAWGFGEAVGVGSGDAHAGRGSGGVDRPGRGVGAA